MIPELRPALLSILLVGAPARAFAAEAPGQEGAAPASASPASPDGEEAEGVVVTATRTPRPLRDVPAAVTVLPRSEIERLPGKTTDEVLRMVPSFALFRRTSSVVSDPTAQGANLRGIGPSGVSRSLVLVDGVPANDPFGGWIYWRAIPRIGVGSVEVVPGGGSALYGDFALGGVTQVLSRPITPLAVEAFAEGGSLGTALAGLHASDRRGPIAMAIETELFRSDGYEVVAPEDRGPVDGPAPSDHAVVTARIDARAAPDLALSFRAGWFQEDQNGGTTYTTAEVRRLEWSGRGAWGAGTAGSLDVGVFGHQNGFEQQRARITDGGTGVERSAESLASSQDVPAEDVGGSAVWSSRPLALAGAHALTAGVEARRVEGEAREDLFPATTTPTSIVRSEAGGVQRLYGAFVQDVWDPSPVLSIQLALRADRWTNAHGSRKERLGDGSTREVLFPDRDDGAWSPKAGLRLRPLEWLTLRAAAYRAFRAPTLNELYRPFQVGLVRTEANEGLEPERLRGAEAGVEVAGLAGSLRITGFWSSLEGAITNVTVDPANPNLRRRQNVGTARVRGVEAEGAWRIARAWTATAAYTFVDSEVTEAPGQPQLVGNDLPQDARHRATASIAFDDPRILAAAVTVRHLGRQYEDDLNQRPMAAATLVDVSASRRVGANAEIVVAVENVLDEEYLVGRAGVDTIGEPRFVHAGIRVRLGANVR